MASQSTIEIVPLLSEHRQSVINLIMDSFYSQEPLNAALKFDIPQEPLLWVEAMFDEGIRDQCSFVAIDTTSPGKEIVGVILNGILTHAQKDEKFITPSEKLNFIFSLIEKVCDGYDLFELYKTDRLF